MGVLSSTTNKISGTATKLSSTTNMIQWPQQSQAVQNQFQGDLLKSLYTQIIISMTDSHWQSWGFLCLVVSVWGPYNIIMEAPMKEKARSLINLEHWRWQANLQLAARIDKKTMMQTLKLINLVACAWEAGQNKYQSNFSLRAKIC